MARAGKKAGELAHGFDEAMESAASHVDRALDTAAPAFDRSADKAVELTKGAVDLSVHHLTAWSRLVERAWKLFERVSNPPWTPDKILFWTITVLLIVDGSVLNHLYHSGVLGLPVLERAGAELVGDMVSLGPVGLFAFTAVSTIFFLLIPTEPFFFVMLPSGPSPAVLITAAALGSTLGSVANYGFGMRFRHRAVKKKGDKAKLAKWGKRANSNGGTVVLFLAACLPIPEIVAVAYGLAEYPFKKFTAVTLAARFVKWTWVAGVYFLYKATF